MSERPSFEDALLTWHGDILALTLTTGERIAGLVEISGDLQSVYVTGCYRQRPAPASKSDLCELNRERVFRASSIIGVEHLVDRSAPDQNNVRVP